MEELHTLQREVEASKVRERQLLKELQDLRAEKELLRVQKEKASIEARDKVCMCGHGSFDVVIVRFIGQEAWIEVRDKHL
jgi:hypothetical protein